MPSRFDRVVELARRRPGALLASVLGLHLLIWTALPILVSRNLQLDLVEDLALGKEWQLGYWKHPPLPWWLADLAYRLTGQIDVVYVLGPLSAVACLYFVWRLGCELTTPLAALVAVLALEGLHFFNFSAVKFAHDQMQLPFWALTGWFFYRALTTKRALDWIASGAFLALAFWSKYAAFSFAATLAAILLFDGEARRAWRSSGPYLMGLAFLVVLSPNLWWLITHGFQPFIYVNDRATEAQHWYDFVLFPLRWTLSQLGFLLPTIGLLAIFYYGNRQAWPPVTGFVQRYAATLALGPFVVTTLVAAPLGRLPVAMWGYPLWIFATLGAVVCFTPDLTTRRLKQFAVMFIIVFTVLPAAYAAYEWVEPALRHRTRADLFPGRELADIVTRRWHEKTGTTLRYVGGIAVGHGPGEFAANNVAVYSPDRPHVIVHGQLSLSPWIELADLVRHGAVFVWEDGDAGHLPADIEKAYAGVQLQQPLVLPQLGSSGIDRVIGFAILPPKP